MTIRETSGKKDKKENTKHIIIIAELEGGEDCGDEGGTYVERTSLRMRWIATEGKRLISGLDDQSSFPRSYVSPSNVLPFPLAFSSLCPNHVHVYAMVSPRQRQRPGMHQRATQRVTYVFVKPCSSVHHGFTEAETASGRRAKRNATCTNTTRSTTYPPSFHLYATVSPRQRQRPGVQQRETQRSQTQQRVSSIRDPIRSHEVSSP